MSLRDDVIRALQKDEQSSSASIYSLEIDYACPSGGIADACYWFSDDAMQHVLIVSEDGLTVAAIERAIALADSVETENPEAAGLYWGVVAIAGDHSDMFNHEPVVEGYYVDQVFGTKLFGVYGVSKREVAESK